MTLKDYKINKSYHKRNKSCSNFLHVFLITLLQITHPSLLQPSLNDNKNKINHNEDDSFHSVKSIRKEKYNHNTCFNRIPHVAVEQLGFFHLCFAVEFRYFDVLIIYDRFYIKRHHYGLESPETQYKEDSSKNQKGNAHP